ncbi:outer membrane beta-barrel protein [Flavobacterium sp.]|uniref:outer membrane beta-barrel protein n=1 Tax=Flavobacterium sp. TaxID=239 RepID=UPI00261E4B5D|nr:outer membrane beta-barrel protein [Flavobacterium sp.]MDG2431173.1 outer membrane beta-barrel protein [Flavobacterium sp.]
MKFDVKYILGLAVLLLSTGMNAQFYVGVQSGIANLQSDVKGTVAGNRLGGALKVGYIYGLTNHIGIGAGAEIAQYRQEVSFGRANAILTNFEVDQTGSAFGYNVSSANYNEKQTLTAVQIPLFLQYKTTINTGVDFNFRAGVKYFLPLSYKIEASAASVTGTGYYPDVNLTIDNLPEFGFGTQLNYAASGEYKTKGVLMSTFELGFTFKLSEKKALYTAMFLDSSYGSILDQKQNESYIGYNPSSVSGRKANGLYSTDKNATVKPVAFGLTVGLNFQ